MIEMFNFDSQNSDTIIGSCKVPTDFDTRVESWVLNILPNRLQSTQACGGSIHYINRMKNLLYDDTSRLWRRAFKDLMLDIKGGSKLYDLRIKAIRQIEGEEIAKYNFEIR